MPPLELACEDEADQRPVVATKFPETRSRPPWQFLIDDIEAKLQELRTTVESILSTVLPFLHPGGEGPCWTCDDPADPNEVQVSMWPE